MISSQSSLEEDTSILSTSYVPSYLEIRSMRSRMALRAAEISSIENDIRSGVKSQAGPRREALMNANIVAEALLAPVRTLPIELLQEIFTCAIPPLSVERALNSNLHPCDEGETNPPHVRFVLRRVCHLWEIVARNTPRIWSTLAIVDKRHFRDFENGITYSRAQPLDIYIGRLGWNPSIVDRLRLEIGRIRQLILPSPHAGSVRLLNIDEFVYAPRLEVFAWSWIDDFNDDSPLLEMSKVGLNAPNLKFMALSDSPISLRHYHAASLRGLRRLHFIAPQTQAACSGTYLDILLRCPSIEELVVHHISAMWDPFLYDGAKVPLLFLKTLTVLQSHDDDTILFLQDLDAPNLEEVSLSLSTFPQFGDEGRWPVDLGLKSLLAAAQTSLRKLKLEHLCLLGADDQPLLSSLVNLHNLEIKKCIIGNAILIDLTPESSSSAMPCPDLSSLIFDDVKLSGNELFRLVCNRTSSHDSQGSPCPITIKNFHSLGYYYYRELLKLSCSRNITLQVTDNPLLTMSNSPTSPDSDAGSMW